MSLLERAAGLMARHSDRRGFLTKTALVGTALAANPIDFALRPGTAYAAICSCRGSQCDCGSLCCDGYTGFCCELNGVNACPPGTILGGWWKVDSSSFCGGDGPRYYMDCNYQCPSGCGCGGSGVCSGSCAGADCGCHRGCGSRKFGCTHFRYGQCNNQIACIGPILCRVVTCEPPWEIDGTCGRTVRVDEATRNHNAPCLQEPASTIDGSFTRVNVTRDGVHVVGFVRDMSFGSVRLTAGNSVLATVPLSGQTPRGQTPRSGARWFTATLRPTVGATLLCARSASDNQVIDCKNIIVPGSAPIGRLDVAHASFDTITISGWAFDVDVAEPAKVHVYVDGVFAGSGTADRARPDVRSVYPQAPTACGFRFEVPATRGARTVNAYAIGQGNRTVNQIIGSKQVTVPGGTAFGVIDFAEPGPEGITVSGWVIDPDTPQSIDVHAYVDGALTAKTTADRPRPDVAKVYAGYGDAHGFRLSVPVDARFTTHELCLYAIDAVGGDGNIRFACTTVDQPAGSPFGVVESITPLQGRVRVSGWVIDPDRGTAPTDVTVRVDGRVVHRGPAAIERPDVAAVHGKGARHGFSVVVPVDRGRHEVCVTGIDDRGHHRQLGCSLVRVS